MGRRAVSIWCVVLGGLLAAVSLVGTSASAQESRRIALLVGNSVYDETIGHLRNPGANVGAVREALLQAGFAAGDIVTVENAGQRQFSRVVTEFAERASGLSSNDVAFFYYSGHSGQPSGSSELYLIPSDARDASDASFWLEAISFDYVVNQFESSGSKAAWIVAVDASETSRAEAGFVQTPRYGMPGMLIAFAAEQGQSAQDTWGGTNTSPFAAALATNLPARGLSILDVFTRVRRDVVTQTGGAQRPVIMSALRQHLILVPDEPGSSMPVQRPRPEERYALLIGNEDYPAEVGRLNLPHEDVDRIAEALVQAGFPRARIRVLKDQDQVEIKQAVAAFAGDLRRAGDDGVGFFYYSGHGASAEAGGVRENYLMPAQTLITGAEQLPLLGVSMADIVNSLSAANAKAVFVVSDACRNTLPWTPDKGGEPEDKGWVQMARSGLFIAYATADGATAPDDGRFAEALARYLPKPNTYAERAFTLAFRDVAEHRRADRIPFFSPALTADICFVNCPVETGSPIPTR